MNIEIKGPQVYVDIPITENFSFTITQTTVSSFLVMIMLCLAFYFLGRNLTKRPGKMQVLTEKGVTMLYGLIDETMGAHNHKFAPYIGALFLSFMSIFPILMSWTNNAALSMLVYGGTSVIIAVDVALQTTREIESETTMRHYKGFLE